MSDIDVMYDIYVQGKSLNELADKAQATAEGFLGDVSIVVERTSEIQYLGDCVISAYYQAIWA